MGSGSEKETVRKNAIVQVVTRDHRQLSVVPVRVGTMTEIRSAEFRIRRLVRKLAYAARRNRLSAIVAALSRSRLGPSAATAGRLRLIRLTPAARALSTVTASTLATISSSGIGRP